MATTVEDLQNFSPDDWKRIAVMTEAELKEFLIDIFNEEPKPEEKVDLKNQVHSILDELREAVNDDDTSPFAKRLKADKEKREKAKQKKGKKLFEKKEKKDSVDELDDEINKLKSELGL